MFNKYIREKQSEIINSVLECVKINSVEGIPEEGMPFGHGVNDALEYALTLADKMGFRTKNADGYCRFLNNDCSAGKEPNCRNS